LRGESAFRSLRLSILVEGKGGSYVEGRRPGIIILSWLILSSKSSKARRMKMVMVMVGEKGGRVEGWERLASRRKRRRWWIGVRWSLI
jgi:hypothetical protein